MLVIDPAARRVQIHAARDAIAEALSDAYRAGRVPLAHDLAQAAVEAIDYARARQLIDGTGSAVPRSAVLAAGRKLITAPPPPLRHVAAGPVAAVVMVLAAGAAVLYPYDGNPRTIGVFTVALCVFVSAALFIARSAWLAAAHATVSAVTRFMTALYLEVNPPLRADHPAPAPAASSGAPAADTPITAPEESTK